MYLVKSIMKLLFFCSVCWEWTFYIFKYFGFYNCINHWSDMEHESIPNRMWSNLQVSLIRHNFKRKKLTFLSLFLELHLIVPNTLLEPQDSSNLTIGKEQIKLPEMILLSVSERKKDTAQLLTFQPLLHPQLTTLDLMIFQLAYW